MLNPLTVLGLVQNHEELRVKIDEEERDPEFSTF